MTLYYFDMIFFFFKVCIIVASIIEDSILWKVVMWFSSSRWRTGCSSFILIEQHITMSGNQITVQFYSVGNQVQLLTDYS